MHWYFSLLYLIRLTEWSCRVTTEWRQMHVQMQRQSKGIHLMLGTLCCMSPNIQGIFFCTAFNFVCFRNYQTINTPWKLSLSIGLLLGPFFYFSEKENQKSILVDALCRKVKRFCVCVLARCKLGVSNQRREETWGRRGWPERMNWVGRVRKELESEFDLATLSDFFTHAHVTRMPDWFDFRE